MQRYRRRTPAVEAFQMTKEHRDDASTWPTWLQLAWCKDRGEVGSLQTTTEGETGGQLEVSAFGSVFNVNEGDWIVKTPHCLLSLYSDSSFEMLYEAVD